MDQHEIRSRVRRLIRDRQVGCDSQPEVWAGTNGNTPCAACGQRIPKGSVEYEAVLGRQTLHFHTTCFAIWKEECAQ